MKSLMALMFLIALHMPAEARHRHRVTRDNTSVSCLQASAQALWSSVTAIFGPMRIVSTCRPGATVRRTGRPSKHRYGLAIDFYAPRGKKAAVVKWLIQHHHSGGVMTYSNHGHIHIDIGPHFVELGARG